MIQGSRGSGADGPVKASRCELTTPGPLAQRILRARQREGFVLRVDQNESVTHSGALLVEAAGRILQSHDNAPRGFGSPADRDILLVKGVAKRAGARGHILPDLPDGNVRMQQTKHTVHCDH